MKPDIQRKNKNTWHVTPKRVAAEITKDKPPIKVIADSENAEHRRQLREWGIL